MYALSGSEKHSNHTKAKPTLRVIVVVVRVLEIGRTENLLDLSHNVTTCLLIRGMISYI